MTEARAGTALPAAPTRVPPYRATAPLIHPSRLTTRDRGGVGKDLSEGWCLNFAVGCTHGCKFCYVDVINKLFAGGRFKNNAPARREVQDKDWGEYFMVPENLDEAIEETPWERWATSVQYPTSCILSRTSTSLSACMRRRHQP